MEGWLDLLVYELLASDQYRFQDVIFLRLPQLFVRAHAPGVDIACTCNHNKEMNCKVATTHVRTCTCNLQLPVQATLYMRRHKSRTAFYRNIYMKVVLNEQFLKRLHTFRAGDMNAKQTTQETLST